MPRLIRCRRCVGHDLVYGKVLSWRSCWYSGEIEARANEDSPWLWFCGNCVSSPKHRGWLIREYKLEKSGENENDGASGEDS